MKEENKVVAWVKENKTVSIGIVVLIIIALVQGGPFVPTMP